MKRTAGRGRNANPELKWPPCCAPNRRGMRDDVGEFGWDEIISYVGFWDEVMKDERVGLGCLCIAE